MAAINDVCCVCGYLSRCCSSLFTTSISYLKTIMYVICVPTSLFDILMIRFSPSDRMHLNACSIAQMRIIAVGRNRVFLFGNTPIFRSSSIQCHFFSLFFRYNCWRDVNVPQQHSLRKMMRMENVRTADEFSIKEHKIS